MALFKKNKEVTMRIYRTNQQAYSFEETSENVEPELAPSLPDLDQYADKAQWERCPACASILYAQDLHANMKVCTKCGHHFRLSAKQRIGMIADEGSFSEFNKKLIGKNPLDFPAYEEKLQAMRDKNEIDEAIITGECTVGGNKCVLAVMDGFFMMGSMGAALGEKFALAAERALRKKIPFVAFTVSGGARMQEGLVSLMQMSKTAAVLGKLDEKKIPYIVVLTDPTTGGVTASFAMLGDVTIAEKNALIGFAGQRVIEQTVKQKLPLGFQRAEFLMDKGFVDVIVERKDLKDTLANVLALHQKGGAAV